MPCSEKKCWTIHKQLGGLPVGVNTNCAQSETHVPDVMKGNLPIEGIEGITCVHQQYSFCALTVETLSHEIDCSFDACYLSSTKLKWTSHILNIIFDGIKDCFWDDSSGSFTYTLVSHQGICPMRLVDIGE